MTDKPTRRSFLTLFAGVAAAIVAAPTALFAGSKRRGVVSVQEISWSFTTLPDPAYLEFKSYMLADTPGEAINAKPFGEGWRIINLRCWDADGLGRKWLVEYTLKREREVEPC